MRRQTLKIAAAAALVLSLMALTAPAYAANQHLRGWMRAHGTAVRLVRLDRIDGFSYGLSITQPGAPELVIAPGTQRRWLVQINGAEAMLQPSAGGALQIIAADDQVWVWVCWLKKLTSFLTNALACTTPLCFADNFLTLLIDLKACSTASSAGGQ